MSSVPELHTGTVAIVGWTNVGKSTLLNRLVGTKLAAVADVAQTTRHRILGVLHLPGRAQLAFVDTPGIHRPRYRMNRRMVETSRRSIAEVDVVVLVVDAARGLLDGDREVAEQVRRAGRPAVVALNKIDLVTRKSKLLPMIATAVGPWGLAEAVPVSATSGDGCERLVDALVQRLPVGPPLFDGDYLTDQTERSLVAETVREKLLQLTRQELPHATAVTVARWHEREDGLIEIDATVLVDRESQKRIVIGREGGLLKQVGIGAREEVEQRLGRRVFLQLWVKVRQDWRDDEGILRELGLA